MKTYPLAPSGIFRTVQGEGNLIGLPMTFIRLAGCSVGCRLCDTDYRLDRRATTEEIAEEVSGITQYGDFVWLTGGEPTDHDLFPLVVELSQAGYKIALATAGHRVIPPGLMCCISWLSVSPHDPAKWVQRSGMELKLVPGLNGFHLRDFATFANPDWDFFPHRYVSPCSGMPETVAESVAWVETHPGWRLGVQAHRLWGLP